MAAETGAIGTTEEHNIYGDLGSAVAEVLSEEMPVPMERVGINYSFAEYRTYDELLETYGLGISYIARAVRKVMNRK